MIKTFLLYSFVTVFICASIAGGSLEPIIFGSLVVCAYHLLFSNMGPQEIYDPCDSEMLENYKDFS